MADIPDYPTAGTMILPLVMISLRSFTIAWHCGTFECIYSYYAVHEDRMFLWWYYWGTCVTFLILDSTLNPVSNGNWIKWKTIFIGNVFGLEYTF